MITIDIHEPEQSRLLIGQSVPVEVVSLVDTGWADYRWQCHDDSYVHAERKQWGEILSGMDHVEEQLRNHMQRQPDARLMLLLEGMIVPSMIGIDTLKATNKNNIWVKGYSSSITYSQVYAWLYQISKYIEVYQTTTYEGTCRALVAFYKSDQKESHTTMHRYFKPLTFRLNPQVAQLMGMLPGMGEVRAKALVEKFSTVYNFVTAKPEEIASVPGIGKALTTTWLRQLGRWDI